jgi:hypothetical protein
MDVNKYCAGTLERTACYRYDIEFGDKADHLAWHTFLIHFDSNINPEIITKLQQDFTIVDHLDNRNIIICKKIDKVTQIHKGFRDAVYSVAEVVPQPEGQTWYHSNDRENNELIFQNADILRELFNDIKVYFIIGTVPLILLYIQSKEEARTMEKELQEKELKERTTKSMS